MKVTSCKMLFYIHGRKDANYITKYGAATIDLLNINEFLRILEEKHHMVSRNNTKKLKGSSDTVVMDYQDSSNITVFISFPLSLHSSSSSRSTSIPNI